MEEIVRYFALHVGKLNYEVLYYTKDNTGHVFLNLQKVLSIRRNKDNIPTRSFDELLCGIF